MSKKFDPTRPISWSALESFAGPYGSPEKWYRKYILGEKEPESYEMKFGKLLGEQIAKDKDFLPDLPRCNKFEHKFSIMLGDIPLVGYADSFNTKTKKHLIEYKTSRVGWDQKRADKHGQVTLYDLFIFVTYQIPPEEVTNELVWIPTVRDEFGDFTATISLVEPVVPQVFRTKRSMADILKFAAFIKSTYAQMAAYAESRLSTVESVQSKL